MAGRLLDPPSANYQWFEPKPGELPAKKGQPRLVGYVVEFRVNSRNRFGTYTGWQNYRLLIRNGMIMGGGRLVR